MGVRKRVSTHLLGDKRVGQFKEDPQALDSLATVKEAIAYHYVTGKPDVVDGLVRSVMKTMKAGVERDGNGRKIDENISLNAWPKMKPRLADACDDVTAENIRVILRAVVLKNCRLDTSDWTFLIEGERHGEFRLTTVTTGEETDRIYLGEDVMINGHNIELADGDTVSWHIPATGASGTVADSYVTSDSTRITVGRDGLQELFDEENDGKDVVFTVRIDGMGVSRTATMKYVG